MAVSAEKLALALGRHASTSPPDDKAKPLPDSMPPRSPALHFRHLSTASASTAFFDHQDTPFYAICSRQHPSDQTYDLLSFDFDSHRPSIVSCPSLDHFDSPTGTSSRSDSSISMNFNQPLNQATLSRRPSWARDEKTYEAHMRSERPYSTRIPGNPPEYGPEHWSYDDKYLDQWLAPSTIRDDRAPFPALMKSQLRNWSCAGAAVCTALERIDELSKQAVVRGWPKGKALAQFSRTASISSPATAGASDVSMSPSPMASPYLPASSMPPPSNTILTPPSTADNSQKTGMTPQQAALGAVDSPLLSPAGANTPARGIQDYKHADFSRFSVDLSQHLGSYASSSGAATPAPAFDENAWEVYLGNFFAELSDIRAHALGRWKGFTRTLDLLHVEYGHMAEFQAAMHIFEDWWSHMKPELAKYEERVKALRVPDLEQVKKQRMDQGLPL